jgi:hypothetical protein
MEHVPLVSVVIPCYNQAQFLGEALQSVYEQIYANWECIIVNDGSPDNTEDIAKEWLKNDNRFKYIRQENRGLSSARNLGINGALGEYIVTLDSDDKYECTFIEKATNILERESEIGVVSSWGTRFSKNKQYDVFKPIGGKIEQFLFYNASIGTAMFRKKCWEDVCGYDEDMKNGYEDWEFYIRVCKLGWSVHVIQEPLFFYRQHIISMRTRAFHNYNKTIKIYIFQKHKDLYISHYEDLIDYFLSAIELEKRNNIIIRNKIDFRVGFFLLKPFRLVKSLFK